MVCREAYHGKTKTSTFYVFLFFADIYNHAKHSIYFDSTDKVFDDALRIAKPKLADCRKYVRTVVESGYQCTTSQLCI